MVCPERVGPDSGFDEDVGPQLEASAGALFVHKVMGGVLGMDFELVHSGAEVVFEEFGDKAFEEFFRWKQQGLVDTVAAEGGESSAEEDGFAPADDSGVFVHHPVCVEGPVQVSVDVAGGGYVREQVEQHIDAGRVPG